MIIARGALKAAEQIAEGLASAAVGNLWSAGMHYASAAAFAGLAGYSASVSSPASPSIGGGGSGLSTPSSSPAGSVAMAPGAGGGRAGAGGTIHVIVFGSDRELANHVGKVLNNNTRYGGGQLIASKVMGQ